MGRKVKHARPKKHSRSQPVAPCEPTFPISIKESFFAVALVVVVFLAYQPAWHGGLLWDDDAHVTNVELQSAEGLSRIWFDVRATQQYYPLVNTVFWIEQKLWGDATLGYHLVNIGLHCLSTILVLLVLRSLEVPGAPLAAAIFALHPVHVESVAWISEMKNTLSGTFYLATLLAYLQFDRSRRRAWYVVALALFLSALLSKTVTATLPAVVLVILWWKRGRLSWRQDAAPLVPFFVVGVATGVFTAFLEKHLVGAKGAEFAYNLLERCLIAGRALCFYVGKLFWPANLTFIYPRWNIDHSLWWQYLFPLAVIATIVLAWSLRRRTRGPLAAVLIFSGTLFPAIGFFNVYPFRFSFVADHFQYLASLAIITLVASAMAWLIHLKRNMRHVPGDDGRVLRVASRVMVVPLLFVLAFLTWRQSQMYISEEVLYRKTITQNPDCWMAHNNLGRILQDAGKAEEAISHYHIALELKPDYEEAHNNLAVALRKAGKIDEAISHYQAALEIKPNYAIAHNNLANTLRNIGKAEEAIGHYRKAIELNPKCIEAHLNLGTIMDGLGRAEEAIVHYQKVLELKHDFVTAYRIAYSKLAWIRATHSDPRFRDGAQAVMLARRAVELLPNDPDILDTLAAAYAEFGQFSEALKTAHQALELAKIQKMQALAKSIEARIQLYKADKPFHNQPQ